MIGDVTNIVFIGKSNREGQCIEDFLLLPVGVFIVGDLVAYSPPKGFAVQCISNTKHHGLHSRIELTIDFLEIDDIETIGEIVTHVRDFEIEPLMITKGIDIRTKNEIVFFFGYLEGRERGKEGLRCVVT